MQIKDLIELLQRFPDDFDVGLLSADETNVIEILDAKMDLAVKSKLIPEDFTETEQCRTVVVLFPADTQRYAEE